MTSASLTRPAGAAHKRPMTGKRAAAAGVLVAASLAIGGCISIDAPSEPIVIELNINITQEVIYRLAGDVQENIEENPEIF